MDQETKDIISGIQMDILNQVENYDLMARHRATLSSLYGRLSEMLKNVTRERMLIWREWRKEEKSAKDTDRRWEATSSGIEEMELRLDLKALEKMMTSLGQLTYVNRTDYRHTR